MGQTTAQFEGTIASEHLPAAGETLHAFYGKAENMKTNYSGQIYYYEGQRQNANSDMSHLAEYDFMTASTTYSSTAANHHFSFSHIGSMMKFTLSGMGGKTVKKLTLSTYDYSNVFLKGTDFTTSASLDLGTEGSDGIAIENTGMLEAYLMVGATTKTAGKRLVLYVTTTDGKHYAALLTGAEIATGKIYTINATLTEYSLEGAGTESEPYKINTAGDLTRLAVMTNTGMMATQGKYFQLTADIDMAGEEAWVPIGTMFNTTMFRGTFSGGNGSGGNHSISNLPDKMTYIFAGLFGSLSGATIKNVTVNGEITMSGADKGVRAGGIAGQASGSTIEGCVSNCTININSTQEVRAGGIVGYSAFGSNNVKNCQNTGNVSSNMYSGGIIGSMGNNDKIESCTNSGSITSTDADNPAGGIIGRLYLPPTGTTFTMTNCTHSGSSPAQNTAGSIIGNYIIGQRLSGTDAFSTITITNSGGSTTITGSADEKVTGQWPEAAAAN